MPEENIDKKIDSPIVDFSKNVEAPNNSEKRIERVDTLLDTSENKESRDAADSENILEDKQSSPSVLVQSDGEKKRKKVENILELDLLDVFKKLSPEQKQEFKKKGEETSIAINGLLNNAKIKTKKILSLIKEWLQMIPGVNKFFIEQLAKSKLDEIMKLNNK